MDKLDRANIHAARRLPNEQHGGISVDFTREDEFLLVATGKRREEQLRPGRTHIKLRHLCRARCKDRRFVAQSPAIEACCIMITEHRIISGRKSRNHAHPQTILRHMRQPESATRPRIELLAHQVAPAERNFTATRCARARQDLE